MSKNGNSLWKLTEEEERENDYKRLQKKFAFLKSEHKKDVSISKSTWGQSIVKSKKDSSIDFSSSNATKSLNKDFCETSQSFKFEDIIDNSSPNKKYENLDDIKIAEADKLVQRKSSESGMYDNTERNNKPSDLINNNTVLVDAMRKLSNNSSFDSIREFDPANKSGVSTGPVNLNLNLILPSSTFFNDDKSVFVSDKSKSIYKSITDNESIKKKSKSSVPDIVSKPLKNVLDPPQSNNSLFFYNPEYNLSTRLLNDEKDRNKTIPIEGDKKFISQIRDRRKANKHLDLKNFLKLSDSSFFNFLSFCFDNYENIKSSSKTLAFKTHITLSNRFSKLIEQFRERYKDELELQEYTFAIEKMRNKPRVSSCLNINIKSKIISNKLYTTSELGLRYKINSNHEDVFSFNWCYDKKKKGEIAYWIASEAEQFEHSIVRYSYVQPILSFAPGDTLEINFPVISSSAVLKVEDTVWEELRVVETPRPNFLNYEKTLRKSNMKFDPLRFCEFEKVIHVWKSDQSLSIRKSIDEFKKYFGKHFKISSITYDIFKLYIFKVRMTAIEKGAIKRNKFMNFEMNIVEGEEEVFHEIKPLGVLNHHHKRFEVRVGTPLIMYFTDIYI